MNRRRWLQGMLLGGATLALPRLSTARAATVAATGGFAQIERAFGVQLGVAAFDGNSGQGFANRADQRFALCSTFKLLLAAAVLARVDEGRERLDRRLVFTADALLEYAPVTRKHVGKPGMSVAELCHAAITLSDNTAANVLLETLDGPAGLTRYIRTLGDPLTRLDRNEPALNHVVAGDPRDTTTPAAMLADMRKLLLDDALSPASCKQLLDWLRASHTGDQRLRAGVPRDWGAGDKTGSGADASNDLAIFWPPGRAPLLVAAYCNGGNDGDRDHALAATARHIAATVRNGS